MSFEDSVKGVLENAFAILPSLPVEVPETIPTPTTANSNKRLAPDTSPERHAPFATGSSTSRTTVLSIADGGTGADEDFPMLKSRKGLVPFVQDVPMPLAETEVEEPTRKRLRRGTANDSPPSYITSPVESENSSPAPTTLTSPAEESLPSLAQASKLGVQLARFNVDSAPSSSASSAYGGASIPETKAVSTETSVPTETVAPIAVAATLPVPQVVAPAIAMEEESQPVVGYSGRPIRAVRKGKANIVEEVEDEEEGEEDDDDDDDDDDGGEYGEDPVSSPVKPAGRLVRGGRKVPVLEPAAPNLGMVDIRSSPLGAPLPLASAKFSPRISGSLPSLPGSSIHNGHQQYSSNQAAMSSQQQQQIYQQQQVQHSQMYQQQQQQQQLLRQQQMQQQQQQQHQQPQQQQQQQGYNTSGPQSFQTGPRPPTFNAGGSPTFGYGTPISNQLHQSPTGGSPSLPPLPIMGRPLGGGQSTVPAIAATDTGYQALMQKIKGTFAESDVWRAWNIGEFNENKAIAVLVNATKPSVPVSNPNNSGNPIPRPLSLPQGQPINRVPPNNNRNVSGPLAGPPSQGQTYGYPANQYAPSSTGNYSQNQSSQPLSPQQQQQQQLYRQQVQNQQSQAPRPGQPYLLQGQQQQLQQQTQSQGPNQLPSGYPQVYLAGQPNQIQYQNHLNNSNNNNNNQQLLNQQSTPHMQFSQPTYNNQLPPAYRSGPPGSSGSYSSGSNQQQYPPGSYIGNAFPQQQQQQQQHQHQHQQNLQYQQHPQHPQHSQYQFQQRPLQHSNGQPQRQTQYHMGQQSYRVKPTPQPNQSLMSRTLAAAQAVSGGGKKKKKRAPMSESDGDGGEYSEGTGDEYGGPTPAVIARRENLALEFFNTDTRENISELTGCNPTQATLVIKLRPFLNPTDFKSRTRKQKGVGNNLFDNYLEVVTGMAEVDNVLSECEKIGFQLSQIMKIWASGASTPATPVIAEPLVAGEADVGLNLVDIPAETAFKLAESSSDPVVRKAFEGYLRVQPEGVPSTIVLKDYQMLGVNWLNLLYTRKTSCILADEMGLGKTAQVIALMSHLKSKGEKGPHLVIVPSSTLENWMREFSVFAPGLHVESYYGSQAERQEIRAELKVMEDLDVIVTTYNIATSSPEDVKFLKRKMDFKICVFDEGHQLKNSESKKYKDLMQIKAKWRLLLTGTPLQNNLTELVSLLSFILPEQFRDANEALRAIFKVGAGGSQSNLLSQERITRAKKMMTPFVLRRKKAQVLKDLPSKTERIEFCDMTPLQRDVYNEALTRSKMALLKIPEADIENLDVAGDDDDKPKPSPKKKGASSTKTGIKADVTSGSNVLIDLRKASNHPMLFRRLYTDKTLRAMAKDCLKELDFADRDKELIFEDMEVMTDFELHRFCLGFKHLKKYCLTNDEWMSAGKIKTLLRLLPAMKAAGDRVLLFSQFTQVLDILEVVLDTMELRYLKLTGQTNVTERQGLVDAYSADPDITVFLLSTRAGGLGLNLTAANTVIFYDQDFNPHNDLQAEDRSYRIGQTRDVSVIKLITKGSVEEDMRALASHKLQLDASVSSNSQYPNGKKEEDGEGNSVQAEKKMRTSLLSNLKAKFEAEDLNLQASGSTLPAVKE